MEAQEGRKRVKSISHSCGAPRARKIDKQEVLKREGAGFSQYPGMHDLERGGNYLVGGFLTDGENG